MLFAGFIPTWNRRIRMSPRFEQVISSFRKWPKFFPPDTRQKLPVFLEKLRVVQEKEQYTELMKVTDTSVPGLVQCMIEDDLKNWFQKKLAPDKSKPRGDWDEFGLEQFACAIGDALNMINMNEALLIEYDKHIAKLEVDYLQTIFDCLDANLQAVCNDCVTNLDIVMDDPKNVEIHDHVSKISMQLFCSIKATAQFSRKHPPGTERRMCDYEDWFESSLPNWINTWGTTGIAYTLTMIQNDNDFIKASERSVYLESAVNLLTMCKGICTDYHRVKFEKNIIRVEAAINICDKLCRCVEVYAENLGQKLKLTNLPKHIEIQDLIFYAANSSEYVGVYNAENLIKFLEIEATVKTMNNNEEETTQGEVILATNTSRIQSCSENTHETAISLLKMAVQYEAKQILSHVQDSMPQPEEKKVRKENRLQLRKKTVLGDFRGGEGLLKYLDGILVSYKNKLLDTLFSPVCSIVFESVLSCINKELAVGQRDDYYQNVKTFMDCLDDYFKSTQTEYLLDSRRTYEDLRKMVLMCSFSTPELLSEFYSIEASRQCSVVRNTGSLCYIKVMLGWTWKKGMMKKTSNEKEIHVVLMSGHNMPILDMSSSDIYLRISLDPFSIFRGDKYMVDSKVKWKTLNPVYHEKFSFTVDPATLEREGAVLSMTAYDKDRGVGMHDDLAGQAFVALSSIPEIPPGKHIDDMDEINLLLTMPTEENEAYLVMRGRCGWDNVAESFYNYQHHLIHRKSKPAHSSDLRNVTVKLDSLIYSTGITHTFNRWMKRDSFGSGPGPG